MKDETFQPSHWLHWFTHDDVEWFQRPFEILIDGVPHTIATDSVMLLAMRGGGIAEPYAGTKTKIPESAVGFIRAAASQSVQTMATTDLLAACGDTTITISEIECGYCHGKRKVRHDCDCEFCTELNEDCDRCDGTGKAKKSSEETRFRRFGSIVVDAFRLGYILRHAPAAATVAIAENGKMMFLRTPEWVACLTGAGERRPVDTYIGPLFAAVPSEG